MEPRISRKELKEYLRTEEHRKKCEPYERLKQKYILLQKKYWNSFQELNEVVMEHAYRREYAKGGETIHRGFYSPSARDLVVGGCNRGKLYKVVRKNSKYDYEYIFDREGRMICAKQYTYDFDGHQVYIIEFLLYEVDKVISLAYKASNHELDYMSECQYDKGKLCRYEHVLYDGNVNELWGIEIKVEETEYVNDLMRTIVWSSYIEVENKQILSRCKWSFNKLLSRIKFNFDRDEEGKLSTYKVEEWNCIKDVWEQDSRVFRVLGELESSKR